MNGRAGPVHNRAVMPQGDHMAISLSGIAQPFGEALDQIKNYPINWNLTAIAFVVVGCWVLAEFIEFAEERKRMKRRLARVAI